MKRIRSERWIFVYLLYILCTVICGCLRLIFPAYRIFVLQVWYPISVAFWILFEVMMVSLLIRFQKINKLKKREIKERRRKP